EFKAHAAAAAVAGVVAGDRGESHLGVRRVACTAARRSVGGNRAVDEAAVLAVDRAAAAGAADVAGNERSDRLEIDLRTYAAAARRTRVVGEYRRHEQGFLIDDKAAALTLGCGVAIDRGVVAGEITFEQIRAAAISIRNRVSAQGGSRQRHRAEAGIRAGAE